jgi:hypothetical protein
MVFRLTSKARSKLRLADSELASPGREVAAPEWYCNVITLARRPFFLVAHSLSLFGVLVPAAGNTTPDSFGKAFRQATSELLRRYGIGDETARRVVDDGPDSFTNATDRHVIGSMLDFANLSKFVIEQEGHAGPDAVRQAHELINRSPMSHIGMERPERAIRTLLTPKGTA